MNGDWKCCGRDAGEGFYLKLEKYNVLFRVAAVTAETSVLRFIYVTVPW